MLRYEQRETSGYTVQDRASELGLRRTSDAQPPPFALLVRVLDRREAFQLLALVREDPTVGVSTESRDRGANVLLDIERRIEVPANAQALRTRHQLLVPFDRVSQTHLGRIELLGIKLSVPSSALLRSQAAETGPTAPVASPTRSLSPTQILTSGLSGAFPPFSTLPTLPFFCAPSLISCFPPPIARERTFISTHHAASSP